MKRPNSMRHLDDAIRRACGGSTERFIHARTIMANALVASMLPDGVIKGGSALKMRFGDAATRFTTDLDTASATNPELYALKLSERLMVGWEGFSGRVVEREPASPDGIPEEYVMQPGWENLYAEQASNLPVLQNIESAIEWTNSFIQEINDAK
jgi:hypothetical protein